MDCSTYESAATMAAMGFGQDRNIVPAVVAAGPGIVTLADLPPITGRTAAT